MSNLIRIFLCKLLAMCVVLALWSGRADAGRTPPLIFGPTVVATGDSLVHIEGLGDIPSALRLVLSEQGEREGVDYIDFVLIKPMGGVSVAGVELEVTPFYIATTELSVGAVRIVWPSSGVRGDLYATPVEEYYKFFLDEMPVGIFERVRGDDSMPYLPDSLDRIAMIMHLLSLRIGLQVRLPTAAEWIAAADIDDQDLIQFVGQVKSEPESFWAMHLQPVASGMTNRSGLRHVWGNVAEYVRPSFEEAVLFSDQSRSRIDLGGDRAVGRALRLNGVQFSRDRLLYLGGAVDDTHENMILCADADFVPPSVGVAPFFPYPVGMRPVLDLSVAVQNAKKAD